MRTWVGVLVLAGVVMTVLLGSRPVPGGVPELVEVHDLHVRLARMERQARPRCATAPTSSASTSAGPWMRTLRSALLRYNGCVRTPGCEIYATHVMGKLQ